MPSCSNPPGSPSPSSEVFFAALWAGFAAEGSWPPQQVALAAGDRGDSDVTGHATATTGHGSGF